MSIQIKQIALYSRSGEIRTIDFRLGAVNIITGKSRTGKSAIIDIVDYCLGRSEFNMFEGVNRETVVWYAVVLQVDEGQVLLAKPAPVGAAKSQRRVYMQMAETVTLPPLEELQTNTNDQAVKTHLSRLLGISPNETMVSENRTTGSFEATIDHTKYYLFQDQSLVANRKLLFYRQDEDFISQHIKDTMPYFLGAVQEDRLQLMQQLKNARRQLALARRRLTEAESVVSERLAQAQTLLIEAQDAGILSVDISPQSNDEMLRTLQTALEWEPRITRQEAGDLLSAAHSELREAQLHFNSKLREIREAESFLENSRGYTGEVEQQALRLQSINVFNSNGFEDDQCPICLSHLENPPPSVEAIRHSLSHINQRLTVVRREQPRLQEHLGTLYDELEELRVQLRSAKEAADTLTLQDQVAARIQNVNVQAARVVGRISLYLENLTIIDHNETLRQRVRDAEQRVEDLTTQVEPDEMEDLRESILNVISRQMTTWADRLEMEHAGNPFRLDVKKLTVVADTPERPITMERMGSAENWLGCHLISLIALHRHFIRRNRPVPNFLILDQPSQVYFPSYESYIALEGEMGSLDEVEVDIVAVQRMFDFLFDVTEELHPDFQLIVMEHANLSNERFQQALVEEPWRGGRALIPQEWLGME